MPMLWKPILILLLSVITSDPQAPQLKMPGERQPDALPRDLTETETQMILKEGSPRPHVEATLKISDTRLASALKFAEENRGISRLLRSVRAWRNRPVRTGSLVLLLDGGTKRPLRSGHH